MIFPPKKSGSAPELSPDVRQLIIIGANGAGKSRFTSRLLSSVEDQQRVFSLSPLRALFGAYRPDAPKGSIDALYAEAGRRSPLSAAAAETLAPLTEAERLIALLLQEEMVNLLAHKLSGRHDELMPTKLDRVLGLWREIFPENDILRHNGALVFTSGNDGESREQNRLSSGEKLVLYYFGAVLYAPQCAVIPVDSPEMFLHPSTIRSVWDRVESLRPDCTFIYTTHDLDFASTRSSAATVWVRGCSAEADIFDYDLLPPDTQLSEDVYLAILGARRPVLFIEGDGTRSIDAKLYPLIFPEYTIKSLGSCDRVIESTRVFNSLGAFHHLDSIGIVDRDRRSPQEVGYLRRKKIMVPEVAEIENMLMVEEVIRTVASVHGRDENKAFAKVKDAVMNLFRSDAKSQALQHTRHYVKRTIEHRIDGRFASIAKLEEHMADLVNEINPRAIYEQFCREFHGYIRDDDYESVLRVFNQKSMLSQSNVGALTGCGDHRAYIASVLNILKSQTPASDRIRTALRTILR